MSELPGWLTYENGVALSVAWALLKFLYGLGLRLSIFDGNMKQIGMRRSWVTGQFKAGGHFLWEIPVLMLLAGVIAALSWAGLLYEVLGFRYLAWKSEDRPEAIKLAAWRLRNAALSASDVLDTQMAIAEVMAGRAHTPEEKNKAMKEFCERMNIPHPSRASDDDDERYEEEAA